MSRGKSRRPASFAALFLIGFGFFVSSCAGSGGLSLPSDLRFFRDRVEAILLDSASISAEIVLRGDGGSCSERRASFCLYMVKLALRKLRVDTWTRQIWTLVIQHLFLSSSFASNMALTAQIAECLTLTLNPDTNTRIAAELKLAEYFASPGSPHRCPQPNTR
jgi:hypothetical protein